ncbi:MAG: indolepyruvate ferredoxin oxidoreductase family protein [Gammaproteobacteria bacterium]
MATALSQSLTSYALNDRYSTGFERVFLTGTQALVRVVLEQARRDAAAGLNTAGFVSGYRGSPLGSVDLEMWRAKSALAEHRIEFLPAVNEDLAATAILGSQQVETHPTREVDGVYALWYGKGPGIDRAGDALKHGNAYGSSPTGGVLVVAGDDHGCVSSSMPHQSDVAFMTFFMPILNPAGVDEYLTFGEYGYALSRYSGMWVGFKAVSETVESAASVIVRPPRVFATPDFVMPADGLHYRWPDLPGPQIEERLEAKKHATLAFARANPIDRRIYDLDRATFGIVTTGKGHLDLMEALRLLGLDETACRQLGIDIYKVGMVWPLALRDALNFVHGKREILVVEEKRGIIESQFKEYFYDYPGDKPDCMVGKHDERGERLVPWTGELSPSALAPLVAKRLDAVFPGLDLAARAASLDAQAGRIISVKGANRTPYFCSGCPHNTSTKVPDGSSALAGIGCHFMASWMDRKTTSLIQMGGEGVNWAASSKFTGNGHIFQNLGEGTYYHSGSVAIRQAIAAGTNITYKILFNDAVAMTGGQPVDGPVSVHAIAHSVRAEGVQRIALVSDAPEKFERADFPAGVTVDHRRDLDGVQRELRDIPGVTVLIYEQTCATEKRRRRKRGTLDDPKRFAYINPLVCEGCGDCSVESNCLSVEPRETPLGRKRRINLSNCNKDFSCLNGFCPSFVTVEGATRRRHQGAAQIDIVAQAAALEPPKKAALEGPYNLLVTGVGGTGVVTVGALVTMAAHLDKLGTTVLDFTGFAQKFGPVLSFIRIARTPTDIHQVRIDDGMADAVIGCDVVVSASPKASATYRPGMRAVVNTAQMPTGNVVLERDADLAVPARLNAIERVAGADNVQSFDANRAAEHLLGDSVFANVMLLGFAWQRGLVPVSLEALQRAIELNAVAIEKNQRAFAFGRVAAAKPDAMRELMGETPADEPSLSELIDQRKQFLSNYQNDAWAARYAEQVQRVRALGDDELTAAVARSLFKLMAYKDEYEVARLHMQSDFRAELAEKFEGNFRVHYHMAPPLLPLGHDARGRPRKREFGQWLQWPMRALARLKFLRGTAFDIFGYSAERAMERGLIDWYGELIARMLSEFSPSSRDRWLAVARAPMEIRGYGPVKATAVEAAKADVTTQIDALENSQAHANAA